VLGPLGAFPKGRIPCVEQSQPWHTENLDMTALMPGESVNIPVLEGPGVITQHVVHEPRRLGRRVECAGAANSTIWRDEACVEVPLADFFAGQGKPASVESIPVQVSPTGSLTCYWRMPFHERLGSS